jgi:hypothetical protein
MFAAESGVAPQIDMRQRTDTKIPAMMKNGDRILCIAALQKTGW